MTVACRYDYMGNRTLTAAVAAANRTKLGSHGERLSGYDAAADLTTQAAYDMVGNNTSVTDGRGTTTTYTYDALSRLTGVSQPLSTGVTATTAYAYKAHGTLAWSPNNIPFRTTQPFRRAAP